MFYRHNKRPGHSVKRATMMIVAICTTSLGIGSISAIFAEPAYAATQANVRTQVVRVHDLNLASRRDQEVLNQRIRRAAKQVCGDEGVAGVIHRRKIRACAQEAQHKAWASAALRIQNWRLAKRGSD
jgi:UrcA family protein